MDIPDDQWRNILTVEAQVDDRIVEISWDFERETWRLLRFRDDKQTANFHTTVTKVIDSIRQGIPVSEVRDSYLVACY